MSPARTFTTRSGAFEATEVLAEGGMSVVYHALHRETGEHVALKTVRVPDEVHLASLQREIHALGRLRHPRIVRIVAEGLEGGMPWYAMELIAGETLADLRPRLDLRRVLTLVRRICAPLAFLHAEGIVHCDLKPQNVIVKPNDETVLMDFGLASRVAGIRGREVAELSTRPIGTPAYMAPEQIRMQALDPRTDLYALGCMLFELVTGRPPFVGGHDVLLQHLSRTPTAPSKLVAGVPPLLDELVLSLLAKRPRDRIGHADDVALALEQLGAAREPLDRRARAWLYRPELVGRAAIAASIRERLEAARHGSGTCVVLSGESGIGKTYLATEIARRAAPELAVVATTCAAVGALRRDAELQPFRELFGAIADRCTAMGPETTARLLGPRAKVLAPYSPRIARLPGIDAFADPPDLSGPAAREHLFATLRDTLAAFSREQPLLLLIDDLQWADDLTLAFLRTLPPAWLAGQPLAILATCRTAPLEDDVRALLARPWVERVTLGRLDDDTVRDVVRDMLATEAPASAFVQALAERSEGNPFFIAEYLRTAVAEGLIRREGRDRLVIENDGRDLPRSLQDLVGRHLQSLSAPARRLAGMASVLGREVDGEVLERLGRGGEPRWEEGADVESMEATAELLARHVLEPLGPRRFQFVHDKLREVAYADLEPELRRALHEAAARALEERLAGEPDPEAFAAVLAHHWCAAGIDDRALAAFELAARRASSRAAHGDAQALYRRAMVIAERRPDLSSPLRLACLEVGMARAAFGAGQLDVTQHHALAALERLGEPMPSTAPARALALVRGVLTQAARRLGLSHGARPSADAGSARLREAAVAHALLTHRYFYEDDAAAMFVAALRAVNLAERAGVSNQVPHAYALVGFVSGAVGMHGLAASYFEEGRAHGDAYERAFSHLIEGVYASGHGRWLAAGDALRRATDAAAGVHDPLLHELIVTALGHVEFYAGRVHDAQRRYEELLRSAEARGNAQHVTWARFSIARSLLALGSAAKALEHLDVACAELDQSPELQSEIICHGQRARALAEIGRVGEAVDVARATLERILRARPTGFPALEGYVGALDACLAGYDVASSSSARASLRRLGESLGRQLSRFAVAFSMARSSAARYRGELFLRAGRRRRARRAFASALREAENRRMPRDVAAAREALRRAG